MSWELAGNIKGPPGSVADAPVTSVFGRLGAIVAEPDDYAAYYQPLGSIPVSSVFGRAGDIVAQVGDYAAFYASLTGSYANPSWITSLAWSKITGAPATEVPLTFNQSLVRVTNTVHLVNDVADPTSDPLAGTDRYYGINVSNVRGFYQLHAIPPAGVTGQVLGKNSNTDYDVGWQTVVSTNEGIWNYANVTTMADPGTGKFRINAATFVSATQLAISKNTTNNTDRSNLFKELRNGDIFTVQDRANSANYARFSVTGAATDNTSWFQIPVSYVTGGGSAINNNTDCLFAFDLATAAAVSSVFGRTGAIVAQAGDYAAFYEVPLSFVQSLTRTTNTIKLVNDVVDPTSGLEAGTLRFYGIDTNNVRGFFQMPADIVTSVFGRTGAISAAAGDYSSFYVSLSGSYANPSWITSLAWSKLTGVPAYEPALGNPASNGMVLSSTTAGVRSWVSAGGTGTVTQINTNSPITGGPITGSGTIDLLTNVDLALVALQSIKISDATTGIVQALTLSHNTSGAVNNNSFGVGILLQGESSTTLDRTIASIEAQWVDFTDATRSGRLKLRTVNNGSLSDAAIFYNNGGFDLFTTKTNNDAIANTLGESKSAAVASPGSAMSNNVVKNITSISLTAGDWDVRGQVIILPTNIASNGAEVGQANISVGTSASIPRDGYEAINGQSNPTAAAQTLGYLMSLPTRRVSLASTTTVYLCAMTGGNAASRTGYGFIEARRVR